MELLLFIVILKDVASVFFRAITFSFTSSKDVIGSSSLLEGVVESFGDEGLGVDGVDGLSVGLLGEEGDVELLFSFPHEAKDKIAMIEPRQIVNFLDFIIASPFA